MKRIDVQAYADASQPELGQTVILLVGVTRLPGAAVFRIRPVEPADEDDGQWPDGDLLPVTTRPSSDGIELVVGPEIGDWPALLPGTAVEIVLPVARLRGEFLWPSVAPAARPKRRTILGRQAPREARPEFGNAAPTAHAGSNGSHPPARAASPDLAGQPSRSMPSPIEARPVLPPVAPTAADRQPTPGPQIPLRDGVPTMTQTTAPLARDKAPAMSAAAPQSEDGPQPQAAVNGEFVTWYPHARGGRIGPAGRPAGAGGSFSLSSLVPSSRLGVLAAMVAGVLAIEGGLFALRTFMPAPAASEAAAPARMTETAAAAADLRLFEALQVGAVSPRGTNAREGNADKLLELASSSLHGSGADRDTDEGAFWLRRYLATKLGDERTLRALTQLGSVYAESVGRAPDYVKARQMWEIAGAFGDPVAMCFLGTLNEHGLGLPQDRKAALQWFQRAKASGGCPAVDEAIARVR